MNDGAPQPFNPAVSAAGAPAPTRVPAGPRPITIAILAMGGEGGGVLADWLVDLAEQNGHIAQTTSVPGVAQRTGATIYYVELFPRAAAEAAQARPVLALMPLPGDVDIVLASELMEAARAVQRGLVTPDRTTLVASTHRVYAIAEKVVPGDGRVDADALLAHARGAARRFVGFDMAEAAKAQGSVISAVLFGALAGTEVLPFARSAFEQTIQRGGIGVAASLKAFDAAFRMAQAGAGAAEAGSPGGTSATPRPGGQAAAEAREARAGAATARADAAATLPRSADPAVQALIDRAAREQPGAALPTVLEGLRRLIDYQGPAYASAYLDRLATLRAAVPALQATLPEAHTLATELARHLALWMAYEDTVRVAELKTRDTRFARVRQEVGPAEGTLLQVSEYLHPRLQEIADSLPVPLARWLLASGAPRRFVERHTAQGRTVRTTGLRGFLLLKAVTWLKPWRPRSLRFATEQQRIDGWLADIRGQAATGALPLATEIARCQRLVKGYGDTHERGWRKFGTLQRLWRLPPAGFHAADLAALRNAALADEEGSALQAALTRLDATTRADSHRPGQPQPA